MNTHKPHFVANAVLPNLVIGAPLDIAKQGFTSSLMLHKLFIEGQDGWQMVPPGIMIDAADTGRLHVAALVKPDVKGERVFGFAWPKNWHDFGRVLKEAYPERSGK